MAVDARALAARAFAIFGFATGVRAPRSHSAPSDRFPSRHTISVWRRAAPGFCARRLRRSRPMTRSDPMTAFIASMLARRTLVALVCILCVFALEAVIAQEPRSKPVPRGDPVAG